MPSERRVGSPGCIFSLWKTAGPSVRSGASQASAVCSTGRFWWLRTPCPCEEGRWPCPRSRGRAAAAPSCDGCFSFCKSSQCLQDPHDLRVLGKCYCLVLGCVSSAWKPWKAWNLPCQVGRTGPQQPHWERRVSGERARPQVPVLLQWAGWDSPGVPSPERGEPEHPAGMLGHGIAQDLPSPGSLSQHAWLQGGG